VHVLGQANRCEWLQIRTSAGVLGWISGAADYVTLGQPCATLAQAEALTLPTPTPAPPPPAAAAPTVAVSAVEQHFDQGVTHYQAEQWDQAIAEFQAAIRLDPEFGPAYLGLGYSYAFGPNELAKAIEALETYLKLVPAAEDRAEVEQDIQLMRDNLAAQEETPFEIPPGMALFVFKNYSGEAWDVDIGPYFMQVPPNPPDREFTYTTLAIEPGTYTWQAHSPGGGYYITDQNGNKAFEFTVAAGEISGTQCCR
jgi:tetratricopeptide (TPR) repeat protein